MHILAAGLSIVFTALSQVLLKLGSNRSPEWKKALIHPATCLGYSLFFVVTVINVYALQAIELKLIIAWSAFIYILVTIFSHLLLKEPIGRRRCIGSALISLGVLIFSLS